MRRRNLTMAKHFDKQFKLDAVQYYHDHKELGLQGCAKNLGISQQTLSRWQKELRDTGDIASRYWITNRHDALYLNT